MRKWTYLVAALLMSGTAATFTSCIDTTEPAGIEEMRSAKAELLKAKAAVQTALAAKEQARAEGIIIKNAGLEIDNQIKALNLELQQAINEWKKDSLKARRDTLAVSLETKLLELNKLKAEADYELQEALEQININLITMKDDMYARELSYYKALLVGGTYINDKGKTVTMTGTSLKEELTTEQNNLLALQMLKIKFDAQKETFKANLEARKTEQQALLDIYKSQLESVQAIKDASTADDAKLKQMIADKNNELKALDVEESDKIKEIEEARDALLPTANEVAKENEKLEKKEIYTIAKTDGLAAIAQELYGIIINDNDLRYYYYSTDAFKINNATGELELVGDIQSQILNMNARIYAIEELKNKVKTNYEDGYKSAYENIVGSDISNSTITNEDGSIKEEYSSKIANELERWAIDAKQVEAAYKADEEAWLDAYEAYMAALYDYNNYINGKDTYSLIVEAINTYNKDTDKTLAEANDLRTKLCTYLSYREKVDGAVNTGTGSFYDTYKNALTDANKADFDNVIADFVNGIDDVLSLGSEKISTYLSNNENCLLDKFIEATNTFLGTEAEELKDCAEPKTIVNGTETSYVVPEGLEPNPEGESNFLLYIKNQEVEAYVENIDVWVTLYQTLNNDYVALFETYDEINATISSSTKAALEDLEKLWQLEIEGFMIKGTLDETVWVSNEMNYQFNNPYYYIYRDTEGYITKKSVIENELAALDALESNNKISYVIYNEEDNIYEVVEDENIDTAIKTIEDKINEKETELENTNILIKLFEEKGFKGEDPNEDLTNDNCGAYLENNIKLAEQQVELCQADVERIEAIIEKLLNSLNAE